jgi:hypothetical protein
MNPLHQPLTPWRPGDRTFDPYLMPSWSSRDKYPSGTGLWVGAVGAWMLRLRYSTAVPHGSLSFLRLPSYGPTAARNRARIAVSRADPGTGSAPVDRPGLPSATTDACRRISRKSGTSSCRRPPAGPGTIPAQVIRRPHSGLTSWRSGWMPELKRGRHPHALLAGPSTRRQGAGGAEALRGGG